MAVPPTVPTSFLPQQSFNRRPSASLDVGGAFAFICYGALVVVVLASVGVFIYQKILENELKTKNDELAAAQKSIDHATVESLLALRDRLSEGKKVLNNHIALSGLLDALEETVLKSVFLTSLETQQGTNGGLKLSLNGTAKNFNALAAQSEALGEVTGIKDAIFSGIQIDQAAKGGGKVNFTLNALLDPSLVTYGVTPTPPASVPAPTVNETTTP